MKNEIFYFNKFNGNDLYKRVLISLLFQISSMWKGFPFLEINLSFENSWNL